MTRINIGIKPALLSNQHLLAEHREIKRIPNMVRTGRAKLDSIPEKFTLGAGHCKFFYNKLGYLYSRYMEIYNECKKRKFDVTFFGESWKNIDYKLMGSYQPDNNDIDLIVHRLLEKDSEYYSKVFKI